MWCLLRGAGRENPSLTSMALTQLELPSRAPYSTGWVWAWVLAAGGQPLMVLWCIRRETRRTHPPCLGSSERPTLSIFCPGQSALSSRLAGWLHDVASLHVGQSRTGKEKRCQRKTSCCRDAPVTSTQLLNLPAVVGFVCRPRFSAVIWGSSRLRGLPLPSVHQETEPFMLKLLFGNLGLFHRSGWMNPSILPLIL